MGGPAQVATGGVGGSTGFGTWLMIVGVTRGSGDGSGATSIGKGAYGCVGGTL